MIHLGTIPAGATIPIPFTTYAGSTGASVTCSGLAVTDIEIYKDGSATQRSSDAGIALLDTDGIDFDGITGLHGFSIDLSDDTDAGFYAVGSFYWVVVSAITVDSQTVTFLAATFRIGPAESITGYPKGDVHAWTGTAVATPDTAGYPKVTIKDGTGAGEIALTSGAVDNVTTVTTTTNLTNLPTIPNNWLTAAGTAADFTTEIQSGLATAEELATAQADLDIITGADGAVVASASKTGYSLSSAGVQAIWDALTSALTTVGSIGKLLVDRIDAAISSRSSHSAADAATAVRDVSNASPAAGSLGENVKNALADTNELQTDWANGGRLDLLLDDIPTVAEFELRTISEAAADRLERSALAIAICTVGSGSTTTSIVTSACNPSGAVADQFKGRIVIFDKDTTTAALRGQATDITASSNAATPTLTVTALTTAPASGDTFTIT